MSSGPCGPIYNKNKNNFRKRNLSWSEEYNEKIVYNYVICLQISVTLKEWDIPFEDIDIDKEHPIGIGRFGTVYR